MNLSTANAAITDAFGLLPVYTHATEARGLLLAIGLQESRFTETEQRLHGPARGFWQFEKAGVAGVLTHTASRALAASVCLARLVPAAPASVYNALSTDDVLAAAFARLLLWTDPQPLPKLGEIEEAWEYYLRTWRPGKPRPGDWVENYHEAMEACRA